MRLLVRNYDILNLIVIFNNFANRPYGGVFSKNKISCRKVGKAKRFSD